MDDGKRTRVLSSGTRVIALESGADLRRNVIGMYSGWPLLTGVCCWDVVAGPASFSGVTKRFELAMQLMRSHNPQAREDGFQLILPCADEHVEELINAFHEECIDDGLRCWLLELIGEARSPRALPTLAQHLYSGDDSLQTWAVSGLEKLGTKPARQELWKARANGAIR